MKTYKSLTPQESSLISRAENVMRLRFGNETTGHDFHHALRVSRNAAYIAARDGGHVFTCRLAGLLHDAGDPKLYNGSTEAGLAGLNNIMDECGVPMDLKPLIINIISQVSYKGAGVNTLCTTPEAAAVQDADRLDALGAIGIARAFAYGGKMGRPLYDPDVAPVLHQSAAAYHSGKSHTVNHFYEKLLLLKDRMQTRTGRKLAARRHRFLEQFLKEFYHEWESGF